MAKRMKIYISKKDEYVPDNYIGIWDIFTDPQYALPGYSAEEWCLGIKTLDEMRVKTFSAVKKRFDISGAYNFASYWNGNLDAINEMGLNQFTKLSCFSDLSKAIICFDKTIENKRTKIKSKYVSFGINKEIYSKYSNSLSEAIKTGEPLQKVSLFDRHKRRLNDLFSCPITSIKYSDPRTGDKRTVSIDKNETFLRFEQWCKIKGKKKKTGFCEAMALIMEQNPVDGLEDIKAFERNKGIDGKEVVLDISYDSKVKIYSLIPEQVSKMMFAIIRRYNSDPENQTKQQLTPSLYIAQAVADFNKRVPLKYSDPIAYKEYIAIKESENYNNDIMDKEVHDNAK